MAGLIPQSFIDDLLNRSDIVEVVGSRIQLKKAGKNYSALCPFHKEKTPSFSVSPDKQFYYCFGCGAGGNALGFVMDHDQLDFPQAGEELAKRAGMEVPREDSGRKHKPRQPVDSPLYPLLAAAADYYRQALKSHPTRKAAVEYLKGRGLSGVIARDFGLGFAPPGWDNLMKHLGGDALQQELYGLYEARQANRDLDEIMVVEGYMDVIALAQQGLRNAVATLGTATSEEHLKRLFRIVPSVLFCFDGDAAGRKAAWRALEATLPNLQDGRRARFLFLPDGEDPDTLVRAEGTDAFRARIQQHSQPLADYFFQQLSEEADPRSLEGKAHLATLAAPLIEKIPGNNLRALMRQRLAEITGLNGEALQHMAAAPVSAPSSTPTYDDYTYYDASPAYGEPDHFEPPEPVQPQPRNGKPGKKEWKKDWKKNRPGSRLNATRAAHTRHGRASGTDHPAHPSAPPGAGAEGRRRQPFRRRRRYLCPTAGSAARHPAEKPQAAQPAADRPVARHRSGTTFTRTGRERMADLCR